MTEVAIYLQDNGVVAVVYPTAEAVEAHGIRAVAEKDVPAGKPFKIIADTDLPPTRELREAWAVDTSELTDGVGADRNVFEDEP